ncbi:MAG: alpha/beta hydrolase [Cyanobacteria bacterium P01_C01_bin.89]
MEQVSAPLENPAVEITSGSVEIRGFEHYYEWVTAGDRPNASGEVKQNKPKKPVMVFVHGWGGSGAYWRSTAKKWCNFYDCLIYDLRGFGRSVKKTTGEESADKASPSTMDEDPYLLEAFADDLHQLLEHLELQQITINAHSMGASIAVLFAQRWGDRLDALILTCSGIFEYNKLAFETFYIFGRYVVLFRPSWLGKLPLVPQLFMSRFLHRSIPLADQKLFLEDFLQADFDAALGTIFSAVSLQAVETMPGAFESLTMPTLLISGEFDQIIPPKLGAMAADLNTDKVRYQLIEKTGHFPMLEDEETYDQRVTEFLRSVPASPLAP